jgi:hypothetical protein
MLIAHWPLNGNTNDISGNGYHITNYGATLDNGKIGQCYTTNGTSTYLTSPNIIPNTTNNFSLAFWVYPTITGYVLSPASYGYDHRLSYDLTNQRVRIGVCEFSDVNQRTYSTSTNSVLMNKWTHITLILDNLNIKIYVDGVLDLNTTETIAIAPWTGLWFWGQRGISTSWFEGKLNDIRLFNHILTDMEIQEIARAKILHYTFDDMQEPTTNLTDPTFSTWGLDSSGYANVGIRTIISPYYCRITDVDSNTRMSKVISGISAGVTYTASVKFKKITGAPTIRFQIQQLNSGGTNIGQLFPTTVQLGIQDIDNWQTAIYTFTTIANTASLRWYIQDGNDYTGYTHIFELREIQIESKSYVTDFVVGSRTGFVRDYSGFFNNSDSLTEGNTPKWVSDSKIGMGAYKLDNPTTTSNFITKAGFYSPENITMSIW